MCRKNLFRLLILSFLLLWLMTNHASAEAEKTEIAPTTWAGLQAAINDAESGATIRLTDHLTADISDTSLVIPEGKNVILDLAGFTLDRGLKALDADQGSVIRIAAGSVLTIRCSGEERGMITGGYALYGGGIYNEGTLILEGGSVSGNTCEGLGGGIYNAYILIIQGGEVTGNTAKENAGGVFNYRSGSMSANPRSIYGNTSPIDPDIDNDGYMTLVGERAGEPAAVTTFVELLSLLPPLALLLSLLFAVAIDSYLSRNQKKTLYLITAVAFCLIAQDFLGYRMSFFEKTPPLRTLNAAIGYALRPTILALFLCLVQPEKKHRAVWALTAFNGALYLTALFSPLTFYFAVNNRFVTGPLHQACTIFSAALLGLLLWQTVRVFHPQDRKETWIPVFSAALIALCVFLDFRVKYNDRPVSFLNIGVAISCMLYYIWLHLQFVREHEQALQAEQRIKIMTTQIQPHFLYNTLSTIQALCETDPKAARQTVEKFSVYLRQNIASLAQESLIRLEEELSHTRIYADIEMMRFENIEIRYDIQDTDFCVPALSIQPLVENAIRHGVRIREKGIITISTQKQDNWHVIQVRDNGKGFDSRRVAQLSDAHVGIRNVRERIETMCGGTMSVESGPDQGTTVTIRIPGKESEKEKRV